MCKSNFNCDEGLINIVLFFFFPLSLVFSYSASNSVREVTKQNFDTCNISNPLKTYSNGNTTVTLSAPGDRYFVSGNRLYCFGGMKLHVHVPADEVASPIGSPQAQPSATGTPLPVQPSSKSNKPSANIPTSSGISSYGGSNSVVVAFVSFMASYLLWMVQA